MTHSGTWKNLEREIAEDLTEATGFKCSRNILSGANNRNDRGDPRPGDVVLHPNLELNLLVEAKYRAKFEVHTLYNAAVADAKKHKIKHTVLCTKKKGEHGYLVTINSILFKQMLQIPAVLQLLR